MREYNILLDILPTTVEVGGTSYKIDTNFRTGILFELIIADKDMPNAYKAANILTLYFVDDMPPDKSEAMDAICNFYRCGIQPKKERETTAKGTALKMRMDRIYDFDVDSQLFYAAFLSQYGIDLNEIDYLHWWKFRAMFEGLDKRHEIKQIMEIRATDVSKIENPKEKNRILRLQNHYRIEAGLSVEDKAEIAGAIFGGL